MYDNNKYNGNNDGNDHSFNNIKTRMFHKESETIVITISVSLFSVLFQLRWLLALSDDEDSKADDDDDDDDDDDVDEIDDDAVDDYDY